MVLIYLPKTIPTMACVRPIYNNTPQNWLLGLCHNTRYFALGDVFLVGGVETESAARQLVSIDIKDLICEKKLPYNGPALAIVFRKSGEWHLIGSIKMEKWKYQLPVSQNLR